jgi:hypothetical protein
MARNATQKAETSALPLKLWSYAGPIRSAPPFFNLFAGAWDSVVAGRGDFGSEKIIGPASRAERPNLQPTEQKLFSLDRLFALGP